MMMRLLALLLVPGFLLLGVSCNYEAPLASNATATANVVSGSIVVQTSDEPAQVIILLYDASDPPPPAGTGRPVTFGSVPASKFEIDGSGLLSAPFAVTDVPDGTWLVTALMDIDNDFHPLVSALAGSTCGDIVGAYLTDLVTQSFATVTVEGGELAEGVTILLASEMTVERPAFELIESELLSRQTAMTGVTQGFELTTTPIHSAIYDLTGPISADDPCGTNFLVELVDDDGDGQPDEHPSYPGTPGAYDIWPRIYLSYLGKAQADGSIIDDLEAGESWAAEALIDPTVWLDLDTFEWLIPVNTPSPVLDLNVVWVPAALHTSDGVEEVVAVPTSLPSGAWAVTVVSLTGQTWTLPNELYAYGSTDASYDASTQGAVLLVQ